MDFLVAIPTCLRATGIFEAAPISCRAARGPHRRSNRNDHTRRLGVIGGIVSAHPHGPTPRTIRPLKKRQPRLIVAASLSFTSEDSERGAGMGDGAGH